MLYSTYQSVVFYRLISCILQTNQLYSTYQSVVFYRPISCILQTNQLYVYE